MRSDASKPAEPAATSPWIHTRPEGPGGPTIHKIETPAFTVGRFECLPTAPQWRRTNMIGPRPLVVIPHHAVEILRSGVEPVLASPARCVFYNGGQQYDRRLVDPRGDDCTYFALRLDLLADVVATELGTTQVDPWAPFEFEGGALVSDCYAQYQSILRTLVHGPVDPPALLEPLLELVGALVRSGHSKVGSAKGKPSRGRTPLEHRTLVHEVERLLSQRFAEPLKLSQIAAAVGASPYHLARVFRASTGRTIHEYRTQTRINVAIRRLADPRVELTDLALQLGFSSHSHFSDRFRHSVGIPPSVFRSALSSRGLSSTILTASGRPYP